MLIRNNQVAPREDYYSNSLLQLPSEGDTVYHNFSMGYATSPVALNMLDSEFSKKPEGKAILDSFNATQLENETPGMSWSQWLSGQGAYMLGFGLNPLNWALGEVGGAAAEGVVGGAAAIAPDAASVFMRKPLAQLLAQPVAKYIPETIGKEGSEQPLSLGLLSENTIKNFGTFAGATAPQGIVDNFNQDTNHINWGGAAREMGEMGAFGMAIGSIPYAWGVLRGKVNRGLGVDPASLVDTRALDSARDRGLITPDEHAWYTDYLAHQKNPSDTVMTEQLQNRATEIINKNGHKANTVTNEAAFEILSPDDVSNLHGVIADQLAAGDMPEAQRKALSDFVINGRMDYLRQDPKGLDGVRGYVDFINQKLDAKPSKIAEADKILDDHMLKSVKDNMPFSQKELLKHIKKAGFEPSHIEHLPLTLPENLKQNLKVGEKINQLKVKLQKERRKGLPENKQTLRRIEELKAKQPKILTPKEELIQLRQDLLSNGLSPNYKNSAAYQRLVDLSHVWHNARTLLDRVHLEDDYNRQQAFRDYAHGTLKIADSDTTALAKPDNVMDYMRRRIEGNLNKIETPSELNTAVKESQKVPSDSDAILEDQNAQLRDIKADDAKKELDQSSEKFKEFKSSSESIFKNLILCVQGGLKRA